MPNKDTPGNHVEWVDENGKIYSSLFTFKEDAPIKKMAELFERRIICEEKECNRYELLMEKWLHKLGVHGNLHFEEQHRPTERSSKKENEKLKCRILIETNIQGEPKYKGEYPDIESFQNRTSLLEI